MNHVTRLFPENWSEQLSHIRQSPLVGRYKGTDFLELLLLYRFEKDVTERLSVMANSSTSIGNAAIESTVVDREPSISFFRVPDHTSVQSDPVLF